MKNKIQTSILILTILTMSTLMAASQSQLYDRDSFVVDSVNSLARSFGIVGIYDSYPTTGANVMRTFNNIDRNELSNIEKRLYDRVDEELNAKANIINDSDGFSANVEFPITLESTYYKTSDDSSLYQYELYEQYKDVSPWFDLRSQLYFGDHIYGYTQFAVKDELNYSPDDEAQAWGSNLDSYSLIPTHSDDFEIFQPYKIGLSVGDDKYNFQIGKNRLSMGSGITGNFFIGDNFSKQDYASFSLFSSHVNYTLSVTEFDQQSDSLSFDSISFNGENQYRVMHKINVSILKNLSLDIYQGALFQVENVNLRMITPFMLVHNYFNFADRVELSGNDEANNILGLQVKWVPAKEHEFNLIVTFDQIQMFESADVFPQAYGLMVNYKHTMPALNGMFYNDWEIVYTSPYLYLNEKENSDGSSNYNYDHIFGNNYGSHDEIGYSGYYYGPDNIVFSSSLTYTDLNDWSVGSEFRIRLHGIKGIKYNSMYEDTITDNVVTDLIVGMPELTFSIMPSGSFNLTDYLTLSANLYFDAILYHYHDSNAPLFTDMQTKVSAKFNF